MRMKVLAIGIALEHRPAAFFKQHARPLNYVIFVVPALDGDDVCYNSDELSMKAVAIRIFEGVHLQQKMRDGKH